MHDECPCEHFFIAFVSVDAFMLFFFLFGSAPCLLLLLLLFDRLQP